MKIYQLPVKGFQMIFLLCFLLCLEKVVFCFALNYPLLSLEFPFCRQTASAFPVSQLFPHRLQVFITVSVVIQVFTTGSVVVHRSHTWVYLCLHMWQFVSAEIQR